MKKSKVVIVNGKEYTKESIREMLKTNDAAVQRAIIRIYEYQTAVEKSAEHTIENNGVGFSGTDGNILSSFAKRLTVFHTPLSEKQMAIARRVVPKYAGQIFRIMSQAQ